MAIPSGSGTETVKYEDYQGISTGYTDLIASPTANHIYNIVSIIITEAGGADQVFNLRTFTNSGHSSDEHWLINSQALSAAQTFIWSDKFSFSGVLYLAINTNGSANLDVHTTYIDQDWT